jgi:hypothetical protein
LTTTSASRGVRSWRFYEPVTSTSRTSSSTSASHGPAHGEGPTGPASVRSTVTQLHRAFGELSFKLIEHWGSRDDLGLLQQLGLLPGS